MLNTGQLWTLIGHNNSLYASSDRIRSVETLAKSLVGQIYAATDSDEQMDSEEEEDSSNEQEGALSEDGSEDDVEASESAMEDSDLKQNARRYLNESLYFESSRTRGESADQDDQEEDDSAASQAVADVDSELDDEFFSAANLESFADFLDEAETKQQDLEQLYRTERKTSEAAEQKNYLGDERTGADDEEESEGEESEPEYLEDDFDDRDSQDEGATYTYKDFFGSNAKSSKPRRQRKSPDHKAESRKTAVEKPSVRFDLPDDEHASTLAETTEATEEEKEMNDLQKALAEGNLSTHERTQLKLQMQLKDLEEEALAEKAWKLKGEVVGKHRPENSLVKTSADATGRTEDVAIDVNYVTNSAPVITEDLTLDLEAVVKQRIADADYDDVVRKLPRDDRAYAHLEKYGKTKKIEMMTDEDLGSKSKVGLGEQYAADYETGILGNQSKAEVAETEKRLEVKNLFDNIMYKLNALTSFHYTPKPNKLLRERAKVEKLSKNAAPVSAIEMEEKIPVGVAEANMKTPEELYRLVEQQEAAEGTKTKTKHKAKGVVLTEEERTQQERKALRRDKKRLKRKRDLQHHAEKKIISKLNPGLGNKYAKQKLEKQLKASRDIESGVVSAEKGTAYNNSTQFFKMLKESNGQASGGKSDNLSESQAAAKGKKASGMYRL